MVRINYFGKALPDDTRPLRARTSVPYTVPYASGSRPQATAHLPTPHLNIGFTGVQVTRPTAATVHCGTSDLSAPLAIAKAVFSGTA